jgi:hypothetical protein
MFCVHGNILLALKSTEAITQNLLLNSVKQNCSGNENSNGVNKLFLLFSLPS